jgi:hypothetical protein
MFGLLYLTQALLLIFQKCAAHSWVECVDYKIPSLKEFGNFDRSKCFGYPRGFDNQFAQGFGIDTGYNWGHNFCREKYVPTDYKMDTTLMASYVPGQTIYIVHPAKNHVADTCTNPFIPSESFKVIMSSEVEKDTFDIQLEMDGPDHVNGKIDYLGYQNCHEFCSNQDKSTCVSGWKLPTGISEGVHSFMWVWEFNKNEYYTNCFDAYVSSDGTTMAPITSSSGSSDDLIPSNSNSGSSADSSSGSSDNFTIQTPPPSILPTPVTSLPVSDSPVTSTPPSDSSISDDVTNLPSPDIVTSGVPNFGFSLFNVTLVGSILVNATRLN